MSALYIDTSTLTTQVQSLKLKQEEENSDLIYLGSLDPESYQVTINRYQSMVPWEVDGATVLPGSNYCLIK